VSHDRFPSDFLWGTATAAHQVEGGNHANDWWDWEQQPGRIKNGDTSDPACDHYRRFTQDFDLLKSLHQNAHRLSVEWSRIEPQPGVFSAEALAHYRQVLAALRERQIEPMVTLFHYTLPRWVSAQGGWLNPKTPGWFASFSERVLAELGDLCTFWVTLNEPTGAAYQGYVLGEWPPGHRNPRESAAVLINLIRAHWAAFERMKNRYPAAQVGIAHHLRVFDPLRTWSPLDRAVSGIYDQLFNRAILRSLRRGRLAFPLSRLAHAQGPQPSQDFIGLNYYTRNLVRFNRRLPREIFGERLVPAGAQTSDLGLEVYPQGLYLWLRALAGEGRPIYITENGVADRGDRLRPSFLVDHLRATLRAMNQGTVVRGYFHWTCFDNFEWTEGYAAQFGLMSCDRRTQARSLRASGRLYAEICRTGMLPASVAPSAEPPAPDQAPAPAQLR
jgi:beta-glucosidase